jgi:hypothetical protein
MPFVATERLNGPNIGPSYNEFRIEHTGIIREIRLWVTSEAVFGTGLAFSFQVNGINQFPNILDWFYPTENDFEYVKTGLNIAVIKGQRANFYQISGGRGLAPIVPIFIFETEIE